MTTSTPFASMDQAERGFALLWAASHDWGQAARFDGDKMVGLKAWVATGIGQGFYEEPSFTDMTSLRAWAGY